MQTAIQVDVVDNTQEELQATLFLSGFSDLEIVGWVENGPAGGNALVTIKGPQYRLESFLMAWQYIDQDEDDLTFEDYEVTL